MGETILHTGCVCGWEITGPEDEVVDAVIEHGRKIHNMVATREDVLTQAQRVEEPAERAS
jgi:predicted small metal-binding protein